MRRVASLIFLVAAALSGAVGGAQAQCALPYGFANGQTADATQVMANFNALAACLSPGGSTNSVQYNTGGGVLGGLGPLTNGQLAIGSTGAAPQAQTLTAGTGISVTNSAGGVTIAGSGGVGLNGLYRQVMSATPTASSTGLSTWLNQGSSTVADSSTGIEIVSPSSGVSVSISGRYKTTPSTPYTVTALVAATRVSNNYSGIGIGWFDGTTKLHTIHYVLNNGGAPFIQVNKWTGYNSFSGVDLTSSFNGFSQPIWLQIKDDGTNVSFGFSQDGANFLTLFSVAKSSGYLGASGYNKLIFYVNPQGGQTIGTLMSWTEN